MRGVNEVSRKCGMAGACMTLLEKVGFRAAKSMTYRSELEELRQPATTRLQYMLIAHL